ncbi:hypothetical protein N658DRAFT_146339 [Parathielavia hyrcaniae]|uniref:Uncharacterized protein n=1 Tax=Parathielavia hyrcaniae TaxID=113614 RepID=A0AAN6T005_9PEZI|nr:hypothetical protein N658DRAFT_146339 [Parathielavia hyrcaniae]
MCTREVRGTGTPLHRGCEQQSLRQQPAHQSLLGRLTKHCCSRRSLPFSAVRATNHESGARSPSSPSTPWWHAAHAHSTPTNAHTAMAQDFSKSSPIWPAPCFVSTFHISDCGTLWRSQTRLLPDQGRRRYVLPVFLAFGPSTGRFFTCAQFPAIAFLKNLFSGLPKSTSQSQARNTKDLCHF